MHPKSTQRKPEGYIIEPIHSPPTSSGSTPVRPMQTPPDNQSDADEVDEIRPQRSSQPSPPSYSSGPTRAAMDTANDEAIAKELQDAEDGLTNEKQSKDEEDSEKLAMLLTIAEDDDEADNIIEEFKSSEGRERLLTGTPESKGKSNGSTRRRRKIDSEVDELIGSDDEERAINDSIRMNPDAVEGVTTRRGTVVGRKRKIHETKGVPLTRRSQRENFIERNRRRAIDNAIKRSSKVDASPKGPRRSKRIIRNSSQSKDKSSKAKKSRPDLSPIKLRRSSRFQRPSTYERLENSEEDEEEEGEESSDSGMSDTSVRSSGSAGREEEEDEQESSSGESYGGAEEVLEMESSDEETIRRKRRKQIPNRPNGSARRSSRLAELASPRRLGKSPRSDKKKKKKQSRRRRTDPNSVFEMDEPQHGLTERERKERLEALVKQSAEVAQKLNEAMAAEKAHFEAKEKEREEKGGTGEASPGRTLKKSERDALWPTGPGKEMQPHQIDGVRWLLTLDSSGLNAILADEMGLGKTIQSIAFLASVSLLENRGPHLVIAPKNVVPHWASEFEVFYPGKFKVITHIGAGGERFDRLEENLVSHPDFDILVTSYDLAQRDLLNRPKPENQTAWAYRRVIRKMQKLEFEYVVVDEAHRLKNAESKFSIGLRNYSQAKRRLLLTGTPLSNSLQELWALMNVLNPRIFGNQAAFDEWFSAPFDTSRGGLTISEQSLIVSRLHTILRPFFRRRLRADVCPRYSSADEVLISCPQSALQKAISRHYTFCRQTRNMSANNTFTILRQVANHPYTVCGALYEERDLKKLDVLVSVSGKFLFLYYALPRIVEGGHRVLIFSQFKKALDFLEDLMDILGLKYGRLDGDTDNDARDDIVGQFNAPNSDIPVFLLTTRAGGVGLNLQTADTVVLFDSDWNPSADLQAVSRIQRIGQKRTVHIMRLVSENSIDEAIVERGREKMRTEAVAVGAGKFNTNVDPTENNEDRQKELQAILSRYERNIEMNSTFLDPEAGQARGSTNADEYTKKKFDEWAPQLLRNDETELPAFKHEMQALATNVNGVPEWLRPGANMRSATLALKCTWKWEIPDALQKGVLVDQERFGKLPSKRQRRQRFHLDLNDSDVDSENGDTAYKADAQASESDEISEPSDTPMKKAKPGLKVRDPLDDRLAHISRNMNLVAPQPNGALPHSAAGAVSPGKRILPVLQPRMGTVGTSPTRQYVPLQVQQQARMSQNVYQSLRQPLSENMRNQGIAPGNSSMVAQIMSSPNGRTYKPVPVPMKTTPGAPRTYNTIGSNSISPIRPTPIQRPAPMNTTSPFHPSVLAQSKVMNGISSGHPGAVQMNTGSPRRLVHTPIQRATHMNSVSSTVQTARAPNSVPKKNVPGRPTHQLYGGNRQKLKEPSFKLLTKEKAVKMTAQAVPSKSQKSTSNLSPVNSFRANRRSSSDYSIISSTVSPSTNRRPQFRCVAPKSSAAGSSSARPKGGIASKPTAVVPEVIVIDDSDEEDKQPRSRLSRSSSGSRQGTMKEMREKAAKRKAQQVAAKSNVSMKQEKVEPTEAESTVDPMLVNTLESFTGVKDRALLVATLQKFDSDVQLSADHILMHD